jgi:glycosyltransferase involved in cell wall biosynthesis
MRLMILGDKILGGNSAYSKIGLELCNRLTEAGHKVAHIPIGYANRMGIQSLDNGVRIYESGNTPFSEDVVEEDYIHFKADMLISLKETWCFHLLPQLPINYVPHCIIDHEPLSPLISYGLGTTYRNIAITRFGQRMLKNAGFSSVYIPHAVDKNIFKPIPEHKKECRKLWFLDEDSFVIGIIARNQARKMIPRMLRAFKRFKELNPTVKTQLMLWTNVRPPEHAENTPMGIGDVSIDLVPEMVELGILPFTVIPDAKLIKHGIPDWSGEDYKGGWDMVKMFGAMDVLLNCTGAEGFSLPLVEAQSCGVPVICTDYAGGPEQVGAGLVVPYSDYVILNTPGTRYALCDIEKMAEALTKIYNADREKMAKKARAFALRYDWDRVMSNYWQPFLEECSEELHPLVTKEGTKVWD